jgi:hypothetical protein
MIGVLPVCAPLRASLHDQPLDTSGAERAQPPLGLGEITGHQGQLHRRLAALGQGLEIPAPLGPRELPEVGAVSRQHLKATNEAGSSTARRRRCVGSGSFTGG